MYCFSGVVNVVVVGVNFFVFRFFFSEAIRARAMKLGSCMHLKELWSTLGSILSLDLLLRFTDFCRVFAFRSFSQKQKGLEP